MLDTCHIYPALLHLSRTLVPIPHSHFYPASVHLSCDLTSIPTIAFNLSAAFVLRSARVSRARHIYPARSHISCTLMPILHSRFYPASAHLSSDLTSIPPRTDRFPAMAPIPRAWDISHELDTVYIPQTGRGIYPANRTQDVSRKLDAGYIPRIGRGLYPTNWTRYISRKLDAGYIPQIGRASIPRALLLSRAPCFYPVRLASIPRTLLLSRTYLTRSIQSDPHSCFHLMTGQSYQYSVAAPRE